MKKIIVFIIVILFTLNLMSCVKKEKNIELYKNEIYAEKSTYSVGGDLWQKNISNYAKEFFPTYEEIEYKYSDIEFYSYSDNMLGSSFVLELRFDDLNEYEKSKENAYLNYEFLQEKVMDNKKSVMPAYQFNVGSYFCKITADGYYPNAFSAICVNDKSCILRYFFYYDYDLYDLKNESVLKYHIKKYSNCEWD